MKSARDTLETKLEICEGRLRDQTVQIQRLEDQIRSNKECFTQSFYPIGSKLISFDLQSDLTEIISEHDRSSSEPFKGGQSKQGQ